MEIIDVHTAEQLEHIRALFLEYFKWLRSDHGIDMSYQGVADELASLPGKYAPPQGRLMLALIDGEAIACAALRPLEPGVVELKRMYTRPRYRRHGAARVLAMRLIEEGRQAGYRLRRLDTATFLGPAIQLYESLGFKKSAPYYHVPDDVLYRTVFMELPLEKEESRE
jgi:GNAT superfamily N-acetyltransferase